MSASEKIKQIRNEMRKDPGVDGDGQRIAQLGWLILLKMYDANEKESKILDDNYLPSIDEDLLWSNWASDPEGITGEELIQFVDNKLFCCESYQLLIKHTTNITIYKSRQ